MYSSIADAERLAVIERALDARIVRVDEQRKRRTWRIAGASFVSAWTMLMVAETSETLRPLRSSIVDIALAAAVASAMGALFRRPEEDRALVTDYLRRAVQGRADYRHPPRPRSALEAIARARVMPMELRIEAVRALGDEALGVELSDELEATRLMK